MRKYEAVFIFPAREEEYTKGKDFVKDIFQKSQASIVKEEDMGERELAYPVKKQERGHYYLFETEMDPSIITDLDKALKIRTDIIKYLFVKAE
jgi:small subunit ribosomal protein S6